MTIPVPPHITTPRLWLRPPHSTDAAELFERYAQDEEVTRYLVWKPHRTRDETQAFLEQCMRAWDAHTAFPWVLIDQRTQHIIGMMEVRIDAHRADLGYVLARSAWGQGFASEAVTTIVTWLRAQPSIYRIWAVSDVENQASVRVLEKAGLQREGILRRWLLRPNISAIPRDCVCYASVR
jgi:[ribosomal protein S5]-alanine N-acetyltransferase